MCACSLFSVFGLKHIADKNIFNRMHKILVEDANRLFSRMQCNWPEIKLAVDTDFVLNHSNKDPQLLKKIENFF